MKRYCGKEIADCESERKGEDIADCGWGSGGDPAGRMALNSLECGDLSPLWFWNLGSTGNKDIADCESQNGGPATDRGVVATRSGSAGVSPATSG
jgi:hypothetical protein